MLCNPSSRLLLATAIACRASVPVGKLTSLSKAVNWSLLPSKRSTGLKLNPSVTYVGSKASVVVVTNFNQELNQKQTKSIQHLVASAVLDLQPTDVQITDALGNSLVKFKDAESQQSEVLSMNEQKVKELQAKE